MVQYLLAWRLAEDQLIHEGCHQSSCIGTDPEDPLAVPVHACQRWAKGSCWVDAAETQPESGKLEITSKDPAPEGVHTYA